LEEHR
jgi:hypothetical protein